MNLQFLNFQKKEAGFTLIEAVVYIAIFSIVFVFALNTVFTAIKSYNNFKVVKNLRSEAEFVLERWEREARLASGVSEAESVFGVSPGKIYLNSTDISSGAPKTAEFFLSGNSLVLRENGGAEKFLTSSSTSITSLVFRQISNASTSKAVKIEMTVSASKGGITKQENFYATAVLRNSY